MRKDAPAVDGQRGTLREQTREIMRTRVSRIAVDVFVENGYDQTTVEQIASRAGVSSSSFFRLFASKEDVILREWDHTGGELVSAVRARPAADTAWPALNRGFIDALQRTAQEPGSLERALQFSRLMAQTPLIRAKRLDMGVQWRRQLTPEVGRRMPGGPLPDSDPRPAALAAAALSCLDIAVEQWTESDGRANLFKELTAAMNGFTQLERIERASR